MEASDRQTLLLHIEELERAIAKAKDEIARERDGLHAPRIAALEEDLAETRGRVVETRKSIAARSVGRWSMWPTMPIVVVIAALILARECR